MEDAKDIAKPFLLEYYNVREKSPEKLHTFYQENSTMRLGHGSVTCIGQTAIKEKCMKTFNGCVTRNIALDALHCADGKIYSLVTGEMMLDKIYKRFTETFSLETHGEKKCYIQSNILHIIDHIFKDDATAKVEEQTGVETNDESPVVEPKATIAPQPNLEDTQVTTKDGAHANVKENPGKKTFASLIRNYNQPFAEKKPLISNDEKRVIEKVSIRIIFLFLNQHDYEAWKKLFQQNCFEATLFAINN